MDLGRQIASYVGIAIIGTCLVLGVVPIVRMSIVNRYLNEAELSLSSRSPVDGLKTLKRIEGWAALFPESNVRLGYIRARCYGMLGELPSVQRTAKEMVDRYRMGMRRALNVPEAIQMPANYCVNMLIGKSGQEGLTQFAGYEYLLNLLKQNNELDQMETVASEMLSMDPSNSFATQARDFVYKVRGLDKLLASTPRPASGTPGATNAPPEPRKTTPGGKTAIDYYALARQCISDKRWDEAVRAIDLALALNPDNPALLATKKLALSRDMKWGVVSKDETRVYDLQGNVAHTIAPGTLVEITGSKPSSAGEVSLCKIGDNKQMYVILSSDLTINPGMLGQASEREKALKIHHAQVAAEIDKLSQDITATRHKENPHWPEFDRASREYNDYWRKVKALQKKRDTATGGDRMKYTDELWAMKGEAVRVGQAHERAKKKFDEWQAQHPVSLSSSSKIESLKTELADVRKQIDSLESGQ